MLISRFFLPISILLLFLVVGCKKSNPFEAKVDYQELPAISGELVNVVVEIPAGTNHKIEYHYEQAEFINDTLQGEDRVINFLPYPGNYGFIPGTLMDVERGGDGDALDVLLLSEAVPTGSVVPAKPIGALLLKDRGELDSKIIAIPAEEAFRIIEADNFVDFMLYYDAGRRILEDWFLNYKGRDVVQLIRWEDDRYAWQEIRKWEVD